MKIYATLALLSISLAGIAALVIIPAVKAPKIVAKRMSPAALQRYNAENARIDSSLASLKRNGASKLRSAEDRSVLAGLRDGDPRRKDYAAILAQHGEVKAAFAVEKVRAHFTELSTPDDREMAFYADLAERVGNQDEAAWARDRMGADGHFRVWRRGVDLMLSQSRVSLSRMPGAYQAEVNRMMDDGLRQHPKFRNEIEVLRNEKLNGVASPSEKLKP